MAIAGTYRNEDELHRAYSAAIARRATDMRDPRGDAHLNGTVATLGWLLGKTLTAPLFRLAPDAAPSAAAIRRQRQLAAEMLAHNVCHAHYSREYLTGVHDALLWIIGTTTRIPA